METTARASRQLLVGELVRRWATRAPDREALVAGERLIRNGSSAPPGVPVDDDQAASIMYTSGTTGKPKGAVLTHKNLVMCELTYGLHGGLIEGWRTLIVLPAFHMAAYAAVLWSLESGATIVLSDEPEAEPIMATIEREGINMTTLVPALWNWLMNHPSFDRYDLSSLRIGFTGAAVMSMGLKRTIAERLPALRVMEAFGMTETSACGAVADHRALFEKHGSVGRPVVTIEIRVVDERDRDVAAGEVGEIVYRGPLLLKEYYEMPEATAEAYRGGWFHSGGLVRRDDDGFVYVVDRKKDIIISGGENISAVEVEEVLYAHPGILEAVVIAAPDEVWGESVKAFVVPRPGAILSEEEVIAHCKSHLASFKKPRSVEFVAELPRTATGKVQKYRLRELERERFRRRSGSSD